MGDCMKKKYIFVVIIIIFLLSFKEKINTNNRILIYDSNNNELAYSINNNYSNKIDINKLNNKQLLYILEIEDKNFYEHKGINIKSTFRAIYNNLFNNKREGGSTITQQMIKNIYLNNTKSIKRKANEIILAYNIENKMSKDEILSEYLSSIYFGNNIYGLSNASNYYFNKEYYNLNDDELISFIALWNSPSIYSENIDKWINKKNSILDKLYNSNLININDYNEMKNNINLNINKEYIPSARLFYLDQVIKEFNNTKINNKDNNIINIYTSYDKRLETISSNQNYSMIISNKDGYIVSSIGNNNYYNSSFSICMNGKRDIGSTIKPLLYYEAIKCGMENKKYNSEVLSIKYDTNTITIENNNNRYYGNIDLKTAIAVSDNPYAVLAHLNLGMNTLSNHLKKYNIKAKPYPSLALGSIGMSLYQLNNIYTQFFNDGIYMHTRFINKIIINDKETIYKAKKERILNRDICNKIKEYLQYPFDSSIQYSTLGDISKIVKCKLYGKSGSTLYDSYIIGFNDEYLICIWSGNIEGKEIDSNLARNNNKDIFIKAINILNK